MGQRWSQQTMLFCSGWKYPTAPLKPLVLEKPMLYVTADFDVGTPTEKATWMWKNHGRNHPALVVRPGDDHVSWNCKLYWVPSLAISPSTLSSRCLCI